MPLAVPTEGAKVLIVKFNDYQCPPCRNSHLAVQAGDREVPGASIPARCSYVLKDYPLDPECNVNVANTIHPSACEAAVAVRLARTHNRERGDGGVALREPADADAGPRASRARATSGR